MRPGPLWAAACLLTLLAATVAAQSSRPAGDDPLTGTWGHNGISFLELKFDGEKSVSGTVIWREGNQEVSRAEIKNGSFDPKTGALRLDGEAKRPDDGSTAQYLIEGTLDKDTLSGTFKFADHSGQFTFTKVKLEK